MKIRYAVMYYDYDGIDKIEEFDDIREAMNFIESGLHFVREFTIKKVTT